MNCFLKMGLCGVLVVGVLEAAEPPRLMRFSMKPTYLAISNCVAEPGHVPIPLTESNLNLEVVNWVTAATTNEGPGEFLLEFKQPLPVGTIMVYGAETVSYSVENSWKPLHPKSESGRVLQVLPFPAGEMIGAVRVTVPSKRVPGADSGPAHYRATLPFASLFPPRLARVSAPAVVTASSTAPAPPIEGSQPSWMNKPECLLDGLVDPRQNFATQRRSFPLSSESPEWILVSWPTQQVLRGFCTLRGLEEEGLGQSQAEAFVGEGDPRQAHGTNDWRVLQGISAQPGTFRVNEFFVFSQPVLSQALRLTSTGGVSRVSLGEVVVLKELEPEASP